MRALGIRLKTGQDLQYLRIAAQMAAEVLEMLTPYVMAGVSTEYLDDLCHDYIVRKLKVIPANIGYHGYPKTTCISINQVVCHGIPSAKIILKAGDIVNVDVAIIYNGYYGDTSRMYRVADISIANQRLIDITYLAMRAGIHAVKPDATLGDVGHAIQHVAESAGFSIVKEYCGHGIGKIYHGPPNVLHYGQAGQGLKLREGMVFTIEPMINAGKAEVKELSDGWTVITQDGQNSAQWEHMVAVTADGFELLTSWPNGTGRYLARL